MMKRFCSHFFSIATNIIVGFFVGLQWADKMPNPHQPITLIGGCFGLLIVAAVGAWSFAVPTRREREAAARRPHKVNGVWVDE